MLHTIDRGMGKKISRVDSSLTNIMETEAVTMPNTNEPAKTLSPTCQFQLIQVTTPEIRPMTVKTKRIKMDLSIGFVVHSFVE